MFGTVLLVATATMAIDIGWEPNAQGNIEYIIQIEPEAIPSMKNGTPIFYNLPAEHRGVHSFRFQVGREKLPRTGDFPLVASNEVNSIDSHAQNGVKQPDDSGTSVTPEPMEHREPFKPSDDPWKLKDPPGFAGSDVSLSSDTDKPKKLPPSRDARQIPANRAVYEQTTNTGNTGTKVDDSKKSEEGTSSVSLILAWCTSAGLLAALVYLGWIHLGMRRRYLGLLADFHSAMGQMPTGHAGDIAINS